MKKSMALLKREHEKKYLELTKVLNKLKAQLIQKDICNYCEEMNFQGKESTVYGKEIANNIYAKVLEATGGDICLSIEDKRKDAFMWLFEIEFDTKFYQVPYIFTQDSDNMLDNLVYVRDINDGIENEESKSLVEAAIEKINSSIRIVNSFDVKTVEYSYFCESPKVDQTREFMDVIETVLRYER